MRVITLSILILGCAASGVLVNHTASNSLASRKPATSAISASPVVVIAGISLTNESCPPANGLIDPGETATVNFIVVNSGNAGTANLVATLQPSALPGCYPDVSLS